MIQHELQNNPKDGEVADEIYLLDLDRHLIDTSRVSKIFGRVAMKELGISAEMIADEQQVAESQGHSFDLYGYVQRMANSREDVETWAKFETEFITEAKAEAENILMPGARELIETLWVNEVPFTIFTYPVGDPQWQLLKAKAVGMDKLPIWITDTQKKGSLLQEYYDHEHGYFVLPAENGDVLTKAVVLLDDKAKSFDDYPAEPSRGYWVVDHNKALKSQQGEIPANVMHYDDLNVVVEDLKKHLVA